MNMLTNQSLLPIAFILLLLMIFPLSYIMVKARKKSEAQLRLVRSFVNEFKPARGLEKNLLMILEKTQELVEGPNYSFYILNPSNNQYTLKVVRQQASDTDIAPSYSGLLPYEKEKFDPPLSLPKNALTEKPEITHVGEVPLLTIPINGGKGIIRVGPIRSVSKSAIRNLSTFSELLEVPLANLLEEEDQKRQYEILETSAKAVKYVNHLFIYEEEFINLILQKAIKSLKPVTSLFLQHNSSVQKVISSNGVSRQNKERLNDSQNDLFLSSREILEGKSYAFITDAKHQHRMVKDLFKVNLGNSLMLGQFHLLGKKYTMLIAFEKGTLAQENERLQILQSLWSSIQNFIKIKSNAKQPALSYIELLKSLADMIDQMSPYTVGYSKQMSNYSMAIAKKMGHSEYEIRSIGLAAYLSNIGLIGLSDDILNKEGKYSEEEYEQMKLHSEVGASLIENTIAHEEAAVCVRYHHERIDGNGYPERLVGDQIPVGARIIAVVQTYLAKINGRKYRTPLPFDEALHLLKEEAGSQLDAKIVSQFIQWFEDKRGSHGRDGQALASCWELCSTPLSICSQCAAFEQTNKNCWEFEKNNCLAHGKSCSTCFVYTEAMARSSSKVRKVPSFA